MYNLTGLQRAIEYDICYDTINNMNKSSCKSDVFNITIIMIINTISGLDNYEPKKTQVV